MTLLRGINAEHQSAVANRPHRLGHATPRAAANDTLLEGFNGPVNDPAGRKYAIDLDGKLYLASLTAGGILYGVTGGIANVRRGDVLAIGTPYQLLRVNAGGTAPEWGSGRISSNTTPVSTSGTGEDDLMSYNLPAGLLAVNGQAVRVTAWGSIAGNAGVITIRFRVGTTVVAAFIVTETSDPDNLAGAWKAVATLIRTAATGIKVSVMGLPGTGTTIGNDGATLAYWDSPFGVVNGVATETLSNAVTVKFTGECANGGDSVTQEAMLVEYLG